MNHHSRVNKSQSFQIIFYSINQSVTFRFRNFSVSKLFHFFDGIGFGFEKFQYRKKYRFRFRFFLVSEKISDLVSKFFGIEKKYRIRFRFLLVSKKVSDSVSKFFGIEKSIGFGFDFFWFRKSIGFGFEIFWYQKKDQIKSLENLPELRRFCELIELCELT